MHPPNLWVVNSLRLPSIEIVIAERRESFLSFDRKTFAALISEQLLSIPRILIKEEEKARRRWYQSISNIEKSISYLHSLILKYSVVSN